MKNSEAIQEKSEQPSQEPNDSFNDEKENSEKEQH